MYSSNKIKSLKLRALAFVLISFFILPTILKTLHVSEFHSNRIECEFFSTHLHSKSNHNDALDYFFTPLINYVKNHNVVFENKIFKNKIDEHQILLIKKLYLNIKLRGPPALC